MITNHVTLDHGSGGEASHELVNDILISRLDNEFLQQLDDSAVIDLSGGRFAMTTDSYVVDPIFFPGGDIGSLAVHGTVNDLSMQGAIPLYLTLGLILEEGFPRRSRGYPSFLWTQRRCLAWQFHLQGLKHRRWLGSVDLRPVL